jgi:hypothetical protein
LEVLAVQVQMEALVEPQVQALWVLLVVLVVLVAALVCHSV